MTSRRTERETTVVKEIDKRAHLDEVIANGLKLACFLGKADSAVLKWKSLAWVIQDDKEVSLLEGAMPDAPFCYEKVLEGGAWLKLLSSTHDFSSTREKLHACLALLSNATDEPAGLEVERYRKFLSESSEGIWRAEFRLPLPRELPPDQQVQFIFENAYLAECNPAFARMNGFEYPTEIIGAPLNRLLEPHDPRHYHFLENFVRQDYKLREVASIEKDKNGRVRHFINNLTGLFGGTGATGIWGTQREVTAYKDLEARLTESATTAAEASKAKSAFLANISHEIRTPLSVILGFADLALDKKDLSADTKGYISSIRRNAEQLSEILGEVLDMSKIEASRLEVEDIRFPLLPMVSEVVTFLDLHAREKGLTLSLDKVGPLPKVIKSDPTRLRQILTNLISNAIKFTENGFVKVSLRMISEIKKGAPLQLEFSVVDSGIGISQELHEELFKPYAQAEKSTARRFGGTGLGLHLSKQLAHALGGDLSLAASAPGQGSTFTFTICAGIFEGDLVVDAKSGAATSLKANSEKSEERRILEGKRVLLIEDSEDNQTLIKHYLSAVGILVDVANNGFDGLAKMREGDYDLVVLDIQMPGMDGHQVARSLREQGYSRPIIALTAHAFKEDREKAFRNGFNEYLTKPINRVVLLKTLGNRLNSTPALH